MNTPLATKPLVANLHRVIYSLSDALDLVGVDDLAHGKRVGIMAAECARRLWPDEASVTQAFDLGLLHDIGVSSTVTHNHLVSQFDWESSQVHCEVGYTLLQGYAPLARFAEPVRYHHTRWELLCQRDIAPEIARLANLIYLVDRVDAMAAPYYAERSVLLHMPSIRAQIDEHRGSYFEPALVDCFLAASDSEAFWLNLEPHSIQAYLSDMRTRSTPYQANAAELRQLATIFSRIVDAKSPFTAEHSLGVARLARLLAEALGVGEDNCDKIEIAGLLHDIGKLRIPDAILDKTRGLDAQERMIMNTHSFETYQILRQIPGFEEIAHWAACHHEEPGGSGYPFHLDGDTLPLEARILRVADIFQAMAQDRPYRRGLSPEAIRSFLTDMMARGRVDGDIARLALADIDQSMLAARGAQGI